MRAKIWSGILVALFLINVGTPAFANNIEDITSDHWAYQSVVKLVDKGYISLYQGNMFKGDNKVERYELANVIAKVLRDIEGGRVVAEEDDILTLKNLAVEFRTELVDLMRENEKLRGEIEKVDKDQTIVKEGQVDINHRVNSVERKAREILNDLEQETVKIAKLEVQVDRLETNNREMQSTINRLQDKSGSQEDMERLNRRIFWLTGGWVISTLLLLNN